MLKKIKKNFKNKQGFTLIELLVVIAIIGVLSSVVLASLNSARSKARDVVRLTDMKTLRNILELYYNDNGTYPSALAENGNDEWSYGSGVFIDSLVNSGYMKTMKDPLNIYTYGGKTNFYIYSKGQARCVGCPGTPAAVVRFYLENDISTPNFYKPGSIDACTLATTYVRDMCFY
jgi:type II secretion system protein G